MITQLTSPVDRSSIYVYKDRGVHPGSLKQTLQTLHDFLGNNYLIKTISAKTIRNGDWAKDGALLVMPGGADVPYAASLNGSGNAAIKEFVSSGGAYLGICAGAYYGSSYIEFDKAGELEVLAPRELSFFLGKSIGPVLAKYDYKSNKGARAANIIANDLAENISLFYNGGGYFENAETFNNVWVLGWYQTEATKLPAIVHTKYGDGNVLLSGVHFEYSYSYLLNKEDEYLTPLIPALRKSDADRKLLINSLFATLGLCNVTTC